MLPRLLKNHLAGVFPIPILLLVVLLITTGSIIVNHPFSIVS
jgi:hypothetical protein